MNFMSDSKSENTEESLDQRFENLYPDYDYSLKSSYSEKDSRKRKKMKTMYWDYWLCKKNQNIKKYYFLK